MAKNEFSMACRWCGLIFKSQNFARYCSDFCRNEAKDYYWQLKLEGRKVTTEDACKIHCEEYGIYPHTEDSKVLAPVKVTASSTQWRYVPTSEVDRKVRIIKGGRKI